jgi:hypothetical protein
MKTSPLVILCLGICLSSAPMTNLKAQAPAAQSDSAPQYSADDLDKMLGPIALYPDPLIALILPASTTPSDVVLADRYVADKGDPDKVDGKEWDQSIKALVHYPDVLHYMDQNLDWTTDLGQAFIAQPADVMSAIQQLRAEAKAAGNLKDTPQQNVTEQEDNIVIMPAQPQTIYVPQYDPTVVYAVSPTPILAPLLTFGAGLAVGSWLNHDCDWDHHGVYVGDWDSNRGWGDRPVYNHDGDTNINVNNSHNNSWNQHNTNNVINHSGNGNGNNGGMWKPNPARPGPNRPGGGGGSHPGYPNPPRPGGGGNNPFLPNGGGGDNHPNLPNGGGGNNRPNLPNGGGGNNRPGGLTPKRPGNDAFGGYGRGTSARAASQRGQQSRQQAQPPRPNVSRPAPKAAPRQAPQRSAPRAAARGGGRRR